MAKIVLDGHSPRNLEIDRDRKKGERKEEREGRREGGRGRLT